MIHSLTYDSKSSLSALCSLARFCSPLASDPVECQPLCARCSMNSEERVKKELEEVLAERDLYLNFMKSLEKASNEKTKTKSREFSSFSLAELRLELERMKKEVSQVTLQTKKLKISSRKYWEKTGNWELQLDCDTQELRSLVLQEQRLDEKLLQLKRTNVNNDAFYIWHSGPFGTINTFRLGRLPTQLVDFAEINAAWGQAAVLMTTIAKSHLNFKFSKFRIIPKGSYSRVSRIGDERNYNPLYWDGGWRGKSAYNRGIFFSPYMVAFLACLDELGRYAARVDRTIHMPYQIKDYKIGGYSIQLGDWQKWTFALKYLLTNLKWLVAWTSKANNE
eukprot:GSMAST32.ASY1.ANO1.872.1 assembled CDS